MHEIENKLTNKISNLEDTLQNIQDLLKQEGKEIPKKYRRIPHEEFLDSILSYEKQPPFSQGRKPLFMDNNICHYFPKADLKKFDSSKLARWVIQMEHCFLLHGITNDMIKLKVGVLYLDLETWQWWEWHKTSYTSYFVWSHFVTAILEYFERDIHYLARLTRLR